MTRVKDRCQLTHKNAAAMEAISMSAEDMKVSAKVIFSRLRALRVSTPVIKPPGPLMEK